MDEHNERHSDRDASSIAPMKLTCFGISRWGDDLGQQCREGIEQTEPKSDTRLQDQELWIPETSSKLGHDGMY